ncbi:hypothetical protein [Amycolatopsis thermoflava]|uniref:hypothetical protein n=1 Tax=Amycolatopsis thermoflava TaxID=84480 RepID=UPI003EBF1139
MTPQSCLDGRRSNRARPGHDHHHRDHADRRHAPVRPRVRRRDPVRLGLLRELPAARILLITIASRISNTAFRVFLDMRSGIFE